MSTFRASKKESERAASLYSSRIVRQKAVQIHCVAANKDGSATDRYWGPVSRELGARNSCERSVSLRSLETLWAPEGVPEAEIGLDKVGVGATVPTMRNEVVTSLAEDRPIRSKAIFESATDVP